MKSFRNALGLLATLSLWGALRAQTPPAIKGADDRFKADILIVVAHPDDEAFFTPYAAKAVYDMHKRVAVIFATHGGSGLNHFSRERGPAMASEREIEAREACAKLGITAVWFLDGKDTRSQDLLVSFANWGHGENLEKLIGLIRLTRPEVIFTHFPGIFIGENHGDHQATGVLVTEAFDLARDPTVFPSQLAGEALRTYLSDLEPWQPKKIYFGSDANDQKQFDGTGPTYSVREVSASQKKPYWLLALRAAMSHRTQSHDDFERLSKMTDEQIETIMSDPNAQWWSDPATLIFGKSVVGGQATDEVFAHLDEKPPRPSSEAAAPCHDPEDTAAALRPPRLELGGPWQFYKYFYAAHGYCHLPVAQKPEIGIEPGTPLVVPLVMHRDPAKTLTLDLTVKAPEGWKIEHGGGQTVLPPEETTTFAVTIATPALSAEDLKKAVPQEVRVSGAVEGQPVGEVVLRVLLRAGALPQ